MMTVTVAKNGKPEIGTFRGDGRHFEFKKAIIEKGLRDHVEFLLPLYPWIKLIIEPHGRHGDEKMGLRATVVVTRKKVTTSVLTVAWTGKEIDRNRIRGRDLYNGFNGDLDRRLREMKEDDK